jgi:adenylosuccinate lyase
MAAIWSREAKYERWRLVELAICEAWHEAGVIPTADMGAIRTKSAFNIARCDEIEEVTRHDLMAFVRNLSENVSGVPAIGEGSDAENDHSPARWIHFGVTSYDVIDTALATMMRDSLDVLSTSIRGFKATILDLMSRHGSVPCIGRTHGIHAEPVTFGHKLEGWWHEMDRSERRLGQAREEIASGKISGAVGVHAHVSPEMEASICQRLGLKADPNSTQIVARDRYAHVLNCMAVMAGSLERIATELRNLQRTEILEVQEAFGAGQTGSSAMPHKRNPWNSETVCGLARVVRGNALAMLESVMTWHERDLSNSSLERIVLPDTFHLSHFMLKRMDTILKGLVVFPDRMQGNLRLMGDLVFSEHGMVALIKAGMSRERAYKAAQRNAAKSWEGEDFQTAFRNDPDVKARLSETELDEIFDLEHHLRNAAKNGLRNR